MGRFSSIFFIQARSNLFETVSAWFTSAHRFLAPIQLIWCPVQLVQGDSYCILPLAHRLAIGSSLCLPILQSMQLLGLCLILQCSPPLLTSSPCYFGSPSATQYISCCYCHIWGHVICDCRRKEQVDFLCRQSPSALSAVAPLVATPASTPLTVPPLRHILQSSR